MRQLVCLLIFLFVHPLSAQQTLKTMTYNLQGMKPGTDYETRLYHIIQNLKILDPDIIGLQEVCHPVGTNGAAKNMAVTIADSLSAYFNRPYNSYYSITHVGWDEFYESIGIVSKYPVEQYGYKALAKGNVVRKVVWNHINTPLGKVNFFNTHLSYRPEHDAVRLLQTQQIMEYMTLKENAWPGTALILTGDMNTLPKTEPIAQLTNRETGSYFIDTYFSVHPSLAGFTYSADSPYKRIDYIFHKNTGILKVDSSLVVLDQPFDESHYCSDHLGVMTVFSIDQTKVENQSNENTPEHSVLGNNYPNPFNAQTTLSYHLSQSSFVNISVYNIQGRLIETLVNQVKNAGNHTIAWNAENISSGIYLYKIDTDKFSCVKKCLLVK